MFKIKKKEKLFYFYFFFIILIILFILKNTPGLKGNLDQELRILTKNPIITDPNQSIGRNFSNLLIALKGTFEKKNFENIKIDINYKNFDLLKKNRSEALKKGMLINPDKVNLSFDWKGKKYKASARLKGDFNDHRNFSKQWSLKVNLKNSKSILGMSEFSLQNHKSRNFPYNFIISNNLRRMGLNVPKFETLEVNFNGYDWGLMLAEEHFTNEFLELRKLKKNLIFKLSNEEIIKFAHLYLNKDKITQNEFKYLTRWQDKLSVNFHNKYKIFGKENSYEKERLINYYSLMRNINEKIYFNNSLSKNFIEKYFDIEAFSKMFASSLIWGESELHSTSLNNVRFYINPYNLKISPIPADYDFIFLQNYELKSIQKMLNELSYFYKPLFKNEDFQKLYLKSLSQFENELENISNDIDNVCEQYNKICLNLFYKKKLKKNIKKLKNYQLDIFKFSKIIKNEDLIIKDKNKNFEPFFNDYINVRTYDNGTLKVKNLTPFDIKIISIKTNGNKVIKHLDLYLKSSKERISQIEKKLEIDLISQKEVQIQFKLMGSGKKLKQKSIVENSNNLSYEMTDNDDIKKILNKNIYLENKNIVFKEAEHVIEKFLELPKNYNLKILPGAKLKFAENSGILLKDASIFINGTAEKPVKLLSKNNSWKGIHVIGNNKKSIISNAEISDLDYFTYNNYFLTGGINFYNSEIKIVNSKFFNSKAEDALNIINSNFIIKNCDFRNSLSDAIDSDFSNGEISNSKFINIKGDAIDTSGSNVKINKLIFQNIGDKGISVGEKSILNASNLKINKTKIGIASKDDSKFIGNNIEIRNSSLFDLAAYNKKSIYNGGKIKIFNSYTENKILSQVGSEIQIDEKEFDNKIIDTNTLY